MPKKKGFPALKDMKIPPGGLLSPSLRKGGMGLNLKNIKKSVLK